MAWDNPKDLLERSTNAQFLTDYLTGQYATNEKSNFVLAVDSEWGRGKTYFLKNWKQVLEEGGYPVVYFDAWANDFTEDPLVALISELFAGLKPTYKQLPGADKIVLNIKKRVFKASKLTFKVLLNLTLKRLAGESLEGIQAFLNDDDDDELATKDGENTQSEERAATEKKSQDKAIDDLTSAAFKEHTSKKRAITDFKISLESLLETIKGNTNNIKLPLFIFVDELDRCRPNFAVEVLEVVKHLFDVPGVYFVIATHIDQLAASINVHYGEKFDSRHYLKRFFHQEYVLPEPEPLKFVEYLYQQYKPTATIPEGRLFVLFENNIGMTPITQQRAISQEVEIFLSLSLAFGLSLRDMEQVMVMLKAICLTWRKDRQLHLGYLLFWIMLRQKDDDVFDQMITANSQTGMRDLVSKDGFMSDQPTVGVPGKSPFSIYSVICHYYERRDWGAENWARSVDRNGLNSGELPDSIGLALNREWRKDNCRSEASFIFNQYPTLVKQAGQLHI